MRKVVNHIHRFVVPVDEWSKSMWEPDHKTYMEDGLVREARAADRERSVMSERIDHVHESREYLGIASEMKGMEEFALTDLATKEAQVHATLALVEQQRIANLIEMARFSHSAEDGQRIFTSLEAANEWRAEAGEALGLS